MAKHRKIYGRHRAPSTAGQTAARVAAAGAAVALPIGLAPAASAEPAGGWGPVVECESGNRNVENPSPRSSASGYFQIIDGTWAANGGREFASRAIGATRAEQEIVANRIHERRGSLADWNASRSCWGDRVGSEDPVGRSAPPARAKPSPSSAPKSSPDRGAPARPAAGDIYVVQRGDWLSTIAARHGTTWRELYDRNRDVIGSNPHLIHPGQRLRV